MGGCCSSERGSPSQRSPNLETTASPTNAGGTGTAGIGYNHGSHTNNVYSPASSRAPLTGVGSSSAVSSPRLSANQRPEGQLSSHYNVPLVAPKPWKSSEKIWTTAGATQERQDFFDTRVTGRREVWEALRQVSECIRGNDLETAQGILLAAGITLPTGRLEDGCYDERGELYRVPHIIVKDPLNIRSDDSADQTTMTETAFETKTSTLSKDYEDTDVLLDEDSKLSKGKEVSNEENVKVRCRLSSTGLDTTIYIGEKQTMNHLFKQLSASVELENVTKYRVFYLGKELKSKDKNTMEDLGWQEGHVINVFLTGSSS